MDKLKSLLEDVKAECLKDNCQSWNSIATIFGEKAYELGKEEALTELPSDDTINEIITLICNYQNDFLKGNVVSLANIVNQIKTLLVKDREDKYINSYPEKQLRLKFKEYVLLFNILSHNKKEEQYEGVFTIFDKKGPLISNIAELNACFNEFIKLIVDVENKESEELLEQYRKNSAYLTNQYHELKVDLTSLKNELEETKKTKSEALQSGLEIIGEYQKQIHNFKEEIKLYQQVESFQENIIKALEISFKHCPYPLGGMTKWDYDFIKQVVDSITPVNKPTDEESK